MSLLSRAALAGLLLFVLVGCQLVQADATAAINQRVQQLCTAALKSGTLADCQATPYNIKSTQLDLTDATKQKGVVTAWCAQYDYSQMDSTDRLWKAAHDNVLVTQAQDTSYSFTTITNLPPEGCAGYKLP